MDVGGVTRYATYTSGSGTGALVFTYAMTAGDVDLDGVTLTSPIDLNGGTIKDLKGNDLTNLNFTPPNTANVKANFPSLGMDFVADADGRYTLNGTVYNDLPSFLTATGGTFTRASIGTYYDSLGVLQTATANTPRFDHDPVTHAPKGILIEEQRTNLLSGSYDFSTGWSGTSISNSGMLSPDGVSHWRTLSDISTSTIAHRGQPKSILSSSNTYTLSVYVRKDPAATGQMQLSMVFSGGAGIDARAAWNPTDGSLAATSGSGSTASTRDFGDYFRASISVANNASGNNVLVSYIFVATQGIGATSTAQGNTATGNIYVWGAQLEQGTFATSYIPTTTAAVTRNADSFVIPTAGWANNGPETIFASATVTRPQGNWSSIFVYDGSYTNNRYFLMGSNGTITTGYNGNPNVATANAVAHNTIFNAAGTFSSTATMSVLNSGSVNTGSVSGNTANTTASVGGGNGLYLNGTLRKLKYYPARVPDTQLQLMTQ